jgi:CO dehydrogenase/acetyl-CoA synthase beta subunit
MELFREPLDHLKAYLADAEGRCALQQSTCDLVSAWPEKSSLVMQKDTAVELGGAEGSLFMIIWTGQKGLIHPGRISLVGPDLSAALAAKLPLAQVVLIRGACQDEYETYQALQDILLNTRGRGLSTRFWPDRRKIWIRVSREALQEGFNLLRYGGTLLSRLTENPAVDEAEIIFVTEPLHDRPQLARAAEKSEAIMEALLKMYDNINFDCDDCDYREVCDEVSALKEIHQRLHEERGRK